MREDLIAYALGELNDAERDRVEQLLADDEQLRSELEQIKCCLADVEAVDDTPADEVPGIPRGLADRTADGILHRCQAGDRSHGTTRGSLGLAATGHLLSPVDMTVAIGVLLTVGSLLLPALYGSRNQAQGLSCTNNLRELGQALIAYSHEHRNFFPFVRPDEHAGIYAPRLREAGLIDPATLDQHLVCPASPLAEQLAEENRQFHVPSQAELSLAKGMWRVELQRSCGGSYGYQVGYLKGRHYLPVKNRNHSLVPILADTASIADNNRVGANHSGNTVNVLFQNGSVHKLRGCQVPCADDHLFLNQRGEPAAGLTWHDAVVLPSGQTPGVEPQQMPEHLYYLYLRWR